MKVIKEIRYISIMYKIRGRKNKVENDFYNN